MIVISYIASQFRDGDLDDFFSHENHPWPPSLLEHGRLCLSTKKSDLASLLETKTQPPNQFDAKVFDGDAIVHALPTKRAVAFDDYGTEVFLPWTKQQLDMCNRIDIIWDK